MDMRRILITGGAGFVGSNLALAFKQHLADCEVVALDNLLRRGSELNVPRLARQGVRFLHGDVRVAEDLIAAGPCQWIIDCAAEPSVHAGLQGAPRRVVATNLEGTANCLEAARRWDARLLFLSTSRVYPISRLNALPFVEEESRFRWVDHWSPDAVQRLASDILREDDAADDAEDDARVSAEPLPDAGAAAAWGVDERFDLTGPRSLYGATKLASELLIQEYAYSFQLPALINRCGVLAGPWQMGRTDQGVVALWVAAHHFGRPLEYRGFGGKGKQVRDLLHIDDLFALLVAQLAKPAAWNGEIFNVGGGYGVSTSLAELTEMCQSVIGRRTTIGSQPETSAVDLRIYVSDLRRVRRAFDWQPQRTVADIVSDTHRWMQSRESALETVLT